MKRKNQILPISLLIQLLFFSSCTSLFSQSLHSPGYIITNQGDTVNGFIAVYSDRRLSKTCSFSNTENGIYHKYSPAELRGYRFESGKYYVSREIQISGLSSKYFLEYLIHGKANIYYLRTTEDHYFIEKSKGRMVELDGREKTIQTPEGPYLIPSKYRGTLLAELSDWKDAPNEVEKSSLAHGSLIDLARRYHESTCTDSNCIIYERHVEKLKLRFGMSGGVPVSSIIFGRKIRTSPSPGFQFGGKLELLHSTYSRNRLTYQLDVQFSQMNRTSIYATKINKESEKVLYNGRTYYLTSIDRVSSPSIIDYIDKLDVSLNVWTIKVPVLVNYYFLDGSTRPYFAVGLSTEFIVSQNNDFDYPFFSKKYHQNLPIFYIGGIIKTGLNHQFRNGSAYFLALSYDYHSSTNVNRFYRAHLQTFGLSGGFYF